MNPDDSADAVRRAEHLLQINRPREALRALATTLAHEPDNADALCLGAQAEMALDDFEQARDLASRAAAAAPSAEWPMRLLALSLLQMGQPYEAYQAARGAVAKAPHLWQAHHTMAQTCAGTFGMKSVAYAAAGKAIELAPLEPDAHAILGRVALESGDHGTAERRCDSTRVTPWRVPTSGGYSSCGTTISAQPIISRRRRPAMSGSTWRSTISTSRWPPRWPGCSCGCGSCCSLPDDSRCC